MKVKKSREFPARACALVEPIRPSIRFADMPDDEEDDDEEVEAAEDEEEGDGESPDTEDEDVEAAEDGEESDGEDDTEESDTEDDGEDESEEEDEDAAGSSFRMAPVVSGRVILGHWYWGNLAIDLEGIEAVDRSIPVLMGHDHERRVGFTTRVGVEDGVGLVAEGRTLRNSPHAAEVRATAADGFPWQASAHVVPLSIEHVEEGQAVAVNGEVLNGPGTVFRRSAIREVSFVSVGADPNTHAATFAAVLPDAAVTVADSQGQQKMKPKRIPGAVELSADTVRSDHPQIAAELRGEGIARGQDRERERVVAILGAAAPEQGELAVELVREGVRLADAVARINVDLRERLDAARSQFHGTDAPLAPTPAPRTAPTGGGTDLEAQIAQEWDRDAALREEFGNDRETFAAYRRAELEGKVRRSATAAK